MKRILLSAGAVLVALSTAASAATFTLSDTSNPGSIPGGATNEVLTTVFGMGSANGFYGAEILVSGVTAPTTISATFIGFEAGFTNTFAFNDAPANDFSTGDFGNSGFLGGTDPNTMDLENEPVLTTSVSADGLLGFTITTNGNGGDSINNAILGANPDNTTNDPNYFISFVQGRRDALYVFFDDGGAGPDDNHDDLVVLLTIGDPGGNEPPEVPLPAGGLLLMGGLGAFAVARRRKNKF